MACKELRGERREERGERKEKDFGGTLKL